MGIDNFISLGISWASHRAPCPAGPLIPWLEYVLQWLLGIRVSVTSNIYVYHFLKSLLPSRTLDFPVMYMVWLEQELYWHLGQDRSGLELQFILGRPLVHLHVRKKEGERQDFWDHTGVNKNQCSALESCSVPCVTHLNTHSLFYNGSALVTFSFPFLHCPWLPFAFPGLTHYLLYTVCLWLIKGTCPVQ